MSLDKAQTTNLNKARRAAPASGAEDYRKSIRYHVYSLWKGQTTMFDFIDGMYATIHRTFNRAWRDGAYTCGILPTELSQEELMLIDQAINTEALYLPKFASDVYNGRQAAGGKLGTLTARIPMWINRYWSLFEMAKTHACGDRKLKWLWNPSKEHCSDCARVQGRVYRASTWRKYGWSPKSSNLACGGFRCGCIFIETDDPVTPGRPPSLSGVI